MSNDLSLLEITASLDQPIPFETGDILANVDIVIEQAISEKDPEIVFSAGETLIKANRLAGIGLAKLAFTMKDRWDEFGINEEFTDVASHYWQLAKLTIDRYIRVWEMFDKEQIPDIQKDRLLQRPMKDLVAISSMVASGFPVPEPMWEVLAEAPNNATVLQEIRDIKGVEPRGDPMIIHLERDGTLRAWRGGMGKHVGYLTLNDPDTDVEKAVNRIIDKVGIVVE
jgi:hypothetical protein